MTHWLRSHWRGIFINVLIVTCFVLYAMFLADPLFDKLEGDEHEAKMQDIMLPDETNDIRFGIAESNFDDDHALRGWAFIIGEDAKDNETLLVLKSDKHTYIFDSSPTASPGVDQIFNDFGRNLKLSGFHSIIPQRIIDNGRYQVGIYIKGRNKRAFQWTDTDLIKSKGDLRLSRHISQKKNVSLPMKSNKVIYHIDSIKDTVESGDKTTEINGWAFIHGYGCQGNRIYVVLKSDLSVYVFDAVPIRRPDVSKHFAKNSLDLDNSGFYAKIPSESLEEGKYVVGILIESANDRALVYTRESIYRVQ